MRSLFAACLVLGSLMATAATAGAKAPDIAPLLKTLRQVDSHGKGHREAAQAWATLTTQAQAEQLPEILSALDGASVLAANWLRAAVDTIAERELKTKGTLPTSSLEVFLNQKQHDQRARRLAFEWIARAEPTAPDRIIPQMLNDPSLELRRDAVARVLTAAETAVSEKKNDDAVQIYRQALESARDLDQVKVVTDAMKKLGQPVNLAEHYGFLLDWQLIGPFDNKQGKGFDVAYPPEAKIDLKASYPVEGASLRWLPHHTDEELGNVDLNAALGKYNGVVGYATTEFKSDQARPIEIRTGTQNALKIWLNGKLISSAEVYHANGVMDQYVGRGELVKGRNVILIKACQNEQKEEWAQDWKFQLRVCDSSGKAVLSTDRPAPRAPANQTAANQTQE